MHPVNRLCDGPRTATFWYNPTTGVVRARVPHMVSDQRSLELYNYINGSQLDDLFAQTRPTTAAHGSMVQGQSKALPATLGQSVEFASAGR